jgi:hypothetical protein
MGGMGLQYRLSTLMLLTAATAITLGGYLLYKQYVLSYTVLSNRPAYILYLYGLTIPLWLPVVFIAVAVTRKSLTVPMIVVFGIALAAVIGTAYWIRLNSALFFP